jgi:hypothetical protein
MPTLISFGGFGGPQPDPVTANVVVQYGQKSARIELAA